MLAALGLTDVELEARATAVGQGLLNLLPEGVLVLAALMALALGGHHESARWTWAARIPLLAVWGALVAAGWAAQANLPPLPELAADHLAVLFRVWVLLFAGFALYLWRPSQSGRLGETAAAWLVAVAGATLLTQARNGLVVILAIQSLALALQRVMERRSLIHLVAAGCCVVGMAVMFVSQKTLEIGAGLAAADTVTTAAALALALGIALHTAGFTTPSAALSPAPALFILGVWPMALVAVALRTLNTYPIESLELIATMAIGAGTVIVVAESLQMLRQPPSVAHLPVRLALVQAMVTLIAFGAALSLAPQPRIEALSKLTVVAVSGSLTTAGLCVLPVLPTPLRQLVLLAAAGVPPFMVSRWVFGGLVSNALVFGEPAAAAAALIAGVAVAIASVVPVLLAMRSTPIQVVATRTYREHLLAIFCLVVLLTINLTPIGGLLEAAARHALTPAIIGDSHVTAHEVNLS